MQADIQNDSHIIEVRPTCLWLKLKISVLRSDLHLGILLFPTCIVYLYYCIVRGGGGEGAGRDIKYIICHNFSVLSFTSETIKLQLTQMAQCLAQRRYESVTCSNKNAESSLLCGSRTPNWYSCD